MKPRYVNELVEDLRLLGPHTEWYRSAIAWISSRLVAKLSCLPLLSPVMSKLDG
jgi:hypothetical protein